MTVVLPSCKNWALFGNIGIIHIGFEISTLIRAVIPTVIGTAITSQPSNITIITQRALFPTIGALNYLEWVKSLFHVQWETDFQTWRIKNQVAGT